MTCKPTAVPPVSDIDIPALREKYRQERDKRIRPEGQQQYQAASGELPTVSSEDPHMPVQAREALSKDVNVLVLGGGWSGILAGVHLRKAGVEDVCIVDSAGDFGGVWYWNRYPGVQCDNDAYCYLPLLEEMGFMPSKKFSDGAEIYQYIRSIGQRFELYDGALFHTLIDGMHWDEEIQRWRVSTDRGDDLRARFVIMANGLLNMPKFPAVPGIGDFKGKMFHTSRWDYDYTGGSQTEPVLDKLKDKKVAIIGTGATAIQAIPHLGRYAQHLYVLQRTPSSVDKRDNPPTDPQWAKSLEAGWQAARQDNFHRAAMEGALNPGEEDLICDFWTEITRNMMAEMEEEGWPQLTMEEFMQRREEMDYRVMERARARIESLIDDPATAEALKPWYRFPCKRPLSNNDYYPTFNQDNVTLIDVSATQGVEAMTEKGFIANGREYDIDCMIFASGFEVTSDLDRRWGIADVKGRNGKSIYQHWGKGYQTLHGMTAHGFPNQFFMGLYQGGLNATIPEIFNRQGQHIAYIIKQTQEQGATVVEPTEAAQDEWVTHIRETAVDLSELQRECTPSYFNNEGEKEEDEDGNEKYRWYLGESYGPGWKAFQELLQSWRDSGEMPGMELKK